MTTSTATTTAPYAELAAAVRGDLILPGDPGYDQARAVYNAMIDKRPAADIARRRDTADVTPAVRVRSATRHPDRRPRRWPQRRRDRGVADDAPGDRLVAAPQHHRGQAKANRPRRRRMRPGAMSTMRPRRWHGHSARLPRLDRRGGPDPWRRHRRPRPAVRPDRGQPVAADVVLADGTFGGGERAFPPRPVLALRGGGGDFGIVTSLTFRCHEIGERGAIIGGPVFYDLGGHARGDAPVPGAGASPPEELSGWFGC